MKGALSVGLDQIDDRLGDVPCIGRGALLVVHNAEVTAFPRQPQHRTNEIAALDRRAARAIQAARAHDQVPDARAANQVLTGKLGCAVDAQGRRQGVLGQRLSRRQAAEYVVGAHVDQRGVGRGTGSGQRQGTLGVDAERASEVRLAQVHVVECGGVDDHRGRVVRKGTVNGCRIGDVELGTRECDRRVGGELLGQIAGELAAAAGEQDARGVAAGTHGRAGRFSGAWPAVGLTLIGGRSL